jgi:hypothetical protein
MKLQQNVGSLDRIIRVVLGIALIVLALTQVLTGALAIIAIVLGIVFIVTAVFSFCPIYAALKLNTKQ